VVDREALVRSERLRISGMARVRELRMRTRDGRDYLDFPGVKYPSGDRYYMEGLLKTSPIEALWTCPAHQGRATPERAPLESMGRLRRRAHDFNNLMTAINGYSGVLLENMTYHPIRGVDGNPARPAPGPRTHARAPGLRPKADIPALGADVNESSPMRNRKSVTAWGIASSAVFSLGHP